MRKEDRDWLFLILAALLLVTGATLGLLKLFGLLTDAHRLTASLTLVGVLITAVVSIIGFFIGRQSEARRAVETQDQLERLRLEAAMRAGSLLNMSDGEPPTPAAIASGLLALTKLDRADLAVALLVGLWTPKDGIPDPLSREVAILVVDAALRSGSPNTELVAAELLCRNAESLDACAALQWPSAIDGLWNPAFGMKTKLLIMDALVTMTCSGDPNEDALRSISVRLYGVWNGDPCARVKGCVGSLIQALLPSLESLGYDDFIQGPETITISELRTAAHSASTNPDGFLERKVEGKTETLSAWSARCGGCFDRTGGLAAATVSADRMAVT